MSQAAADFEHASRRARQEMIAAINAGNAPAAQAHRRLALLHVREAMLAVNLFGASAVKTDAARVKGGWRPRSDIERLEGLELPWRVGATKRRPSAAPGLRA